MESVFDRQIKWKIHLLANNRLKYKFFSKRNKFDFELCVCIDAQENVNFNLKKSFLRMETMTKKCFHFFFVWKSVKLFLSKIVCQIEKFQFNRMISGTCPRAFATVASFQKLSNRNIDNLLTIDGCLNSFIHMHFLELVVFSHQYYFAYLYLEKLWREREMKKAFHIDKSCKKR